MEEQIKQLIEELKEEEITLLELSESDEFYYGQLISTHDIIEKLKLILTPPPQAGR